MKNNIFKIAMMMGIGVFIQIASNASPSVAQEKYEPPFCQNFTGGVVKCNYTNGDNYVGSLANGVPNGQGVYNYAGTKDRYEGQWSNGRPNGQGIYIFGGSNARFEGVFRNGNIVSGRAIFENGDRYEGPFRLVEEVGSGKISSQPAGNGRFFFANGDRYEGEFFAGSIFGRGVLIRTDGTRCEAQFFNNSLYGRGTCRYRNGDRYEGELRQGRPHGKGLLIQANGRRYQGDFRDGQPNDGKTKQ